ncbi:MAG TPA: aminotransferase class V-fold PLP-dependent enzyme [Gemmatimonadaceae bacterium]|nr:aminotransferase class V-fold PLP-dependent enzyme [Gemmatimonadaceae bacterium]
MMNPSDRRAFLGTATKLAIAAPVALAIPGLPQDGQALARWVSEEDIGSLADSRADDTVARDEMYWARVRRLYQLAPDVLNLDNGWTNPPIGSSIDELVRNARLLEGLPAEHLPAMWEKISTTTLRASLAKAMKVPGDQIALVRNATEALNNVLLGYKLHEGDEIVCSKHDYYATLDALEQRRARDGIVLRVVDPPIPVAAPADIVSLYANAITSKTKLVLLTHPSNLTGQLLPVTAIADISHKAGAEVVVDGAQSLGLLEDPVKSLGCDYYGASAHKWLGTPVGLGVLWMRPANIDKVWPLLPPRANETGMARFEWIGTCPEYINVASLPAMRLHHQLGAGRKLARIRYLAGLLRESIARSHPATRFYARAEMTFGLTTFEIPGLDSAKAQAELRQKHGILVQAMTGIRSDSRIRGIRVSPNVFTPAVGMTRFVDALKIVTRTVDRTA